MKRCFITLDGLHELWDVSFFNQGCKWLIKWINTQADEYTESLPGFNYHVFSSQNLFVTVHMYMIGSCVVGADIS